MGFEYDLSPFIAFRDRAACERVRAIPRARLAEHPNPDFRIALVDDAGDFYTRFATDLVDRVRAARDEGRAFVAILPVGPMPQYEIAARHDQRRAAVAPARAHVQHGRVRRPRTA